MSKLLILFGFIVSIFILVIFSLILSLSYFGPHSYKIEDLPGQKIIELTNGDVHYQANFTLGSEPILFLHGFNGSMNNWNSVWESAVTCRGAIRLDIPGFGRSNWQQHDYSLPTQSARLAEFLDALNVEKVHIVGTSMGGSLAAWFSAYYPHFVASSTLIAPSGWPNAMNLKWYEQLSYRNPFFRSALIKWVNNDGYRALFPTSRLLQAMQVTASYNQQWVDALALLKAPTHVIWSESDARIPIEYQQKIASKIKQSTLVFADKSAGHDVPGQDPDTLVKVLCQY